MGVHENMCILERPFGIERVRSMGFAKQNLAVVRELVDIMCAPPAPLAGAGFLRETNRYNTIALNCF